MELDLVGAAMHSGVCGGRKSWCHHAKRIGLFDVSWNGGLRTTVYFHNMIELLTEAIGNPTPIQILLVPEKLPKGATCQCRFSRRSGTS